MSMITIQQATLDDCADIQAVANVAFPATYANILSEDQLKYMMEWMYATENLHKQMLDEGHTYYIARTESGVPAGYVSIRQEGPDLYHLEKIYVLPDMQGKHIGHTLFKHAIRAIKALHPSPCRMELNVNRSNPALGFYKRMGMEKVREGDFPIGNGYYMNDYIMGMEL